MTDKISKERLEKIAFGSVRQSQEEGVFIAREALAYREAESEPVAWRLLDQPEEVLTTTENNRVLSAWRKRGFDVQPLYASPVLGQTSELREIAIRVVACISASGYTPKENSLNPLEALLFDAEKALGETK